MTEPAPDASPENYCLITHPHQPWALLLATATGQWTLPPHAEEDAPEMLGAMRARLGLEATILACVDDRTDYAAVGPPRQVYALECHSEAWSPPEGARWIDRTALASLSLAVAEHRAVIERWLAEVETGIVPLLRAPWARPGWYAAARAWIDDELARMGTRRVGEPEQVKERPWSCVLRVTLADGASLYFKAAAPAFRYETRLTAALAMCDAEAVPTVHALEAERGWMLLADTGASIRDRIHEGRDLALWQRALRRYARLQLASREYLAALAATGCPDRRLARLPALYAEVLADPGMLRPGTPEDVTDEELARLRALAPEVERLCAELAAFGLPATVHHDDLGPGNVHTRAGRLVIIDWGEAALTHPFCSLMIPLRWVRLLMNGDAAELAALRDAYLAEWSAYGSLERLRAAAALAERLAYLSRALSWRMFAANVEPVAQRPHLDALPYWLKLFLNDGQE
ncbi:MAG: aminoglycoside phosphotransferase family protein [Ktedonobacterales bacterium]|nr:aminoglycoside phosphotransferase family protein [Ktedonobacterales bacterium]